MKQPSHLAKTGASGALVSPALQAQPHLQSSGPFIGNHGPSIEELTTMDPISADRSLPALVRALASEDEAIASQAERLLAQHPLFCLRRGPWPPPENPAPLQRVFFPESQMDQTAQALIEMTQSTAGPLRHRMVESLASLAGLENIVDLASLALNDAEREDLEFLGLSRTLQQNRTQITVVLNYECNKHCSYCFSSEMGRRLPQPLTRQRFFQTLDWAQRAGASRIAVTGGEPTLHPEFPSFMTELRSRNFTTCFSTNGCGPSSAFECLSKDFVDALTFHILDGDEYSPDEDERLERNIRHTQAKGIPLIFRYVLTDSEQPGWERYLELAARYRPWLMTFSPVFPGPYRTEMAQEVRNLFRAKDQLLHLVQIALRLKIRPMIAKPVPLCMFSREELLQLTAVANVTHVCDVSQNHYTNSTLVTPDLSLYPLHGSALDRRPTRNHSVSRGSSAA